MLAQSLGQAIITAWVSIMWWVLSNVPALQPPVKELRNSPFSGISYAHDTTFVHSLKNCSCERKVGDLSSVLVDRLHRVDRAAQTGEKSELRRGCVFQGSSSRQWTQSTQGKRERHRSLNAGIWSVGGWEGMFPTGRFTLGIVSRIWLLCILKLRFQFYWKMHSVT